MTHQDRRDRPGVQHQGVGVGQFLTIHGVADDLSCVVNDLAGTILLPLGGHATRLLPVHVEAT